MNVQKPGPRDVCACQYVSRAGIRTCVLEPEHDGVHTDGIWKWHITQAPGPFSPMPEVNLIESLQAEIKELRGAAHLYLVEHPCEHDGCAYAVNLNKALGCRHG